MDREGTMKPHPLSESKSAINAYWEGTFFFSLVVLPLIDFFFALNNSLSPVLKVELHEMQLAIHRQT